MFKRVMDAYKRVFKKAPVMKVLTKQDKRQQRLERGKRTCRNFGYVGGARNGTLSTHVLEADEIQRYSTRHFAYLAVDGKCYVARIGKAFRVNPMCWPNAVTAQLCLWGQ